MNLSKFSRNLTVIPLSIGLSIISSLPKIGLSESPVARRFPNLQISQKFIPPNRQAPRTTSGGGSRGTFCEGSKETLIPLIPPNKLGLTLGERPTFYVFVPQIPVKNAFFSLLDKNNIVYTTTFALPQKPGIIGFTLPANAPSLKVGKQYQWYVAIACSLDEPEQEMAVNGWVERIQPTRTFSTKLARTNPKEVSQVYANAGIWYEALHTLIKQRLNAPGDRTFIANWRAFLESAGLKNLVSQPLINNSK